MVSLTIPLDTLLDLPLCGDKTPREALVDMLSQEAERSGQVHRNEKGLHYFDNVTISLGVSISADLKRREPKHGHL